MATSKVTVILILAICITSTYSSNILCLFTTTGQSHMIIHMAIVRTLAERGHNLTVVTTLPLKDKNPKYHHVFLPPESEEISNYRKTLSSAASGNSSWESTKRLFMANVERARMQDKATKDPRFQELLNNPGNHFDLLILGAVFNTYQLGVGAHFKCPVIISWINQPPRNILGYVGSPWSISSVPIFGPGQMQSFRNRLKNMLSAAFIAAIEEFSEYKMAQYYEEHFPATRYPSFDEVSKNVSLVFSACHFTEGRVRPLTPGFVEIGGIQVKETPDQLPQDVEEFLKTADQGFILFSLGTNIKSTDLSTNATSAIFKVLSQSKYKVLWKWDSAQLPGKSNNIMFEKWFPQDDLLAHPKLKLFITHGGKGSLVEAQYHGVPMLSIPIYGDQPGNAKEMAEMGYGLIVNHRNITELSFRDQFYEVLENPKYLGAISTFAKLYRDRPLTPRQSVIYWTEYVIRHRGAKHMQSPAVHLNFFQKNSLDVIGFLGIVAYTIYWIIRRMLRIVYKLLLCLFTMKGKLKSE